MLALIGVLLALLLASAATGAGIWVLAGWRGAFTLAPAAGLALLLIIGAELATGTGGAGDAFVGCLTAVLVGTLLGGAGLLFARDRGAPWPAREELVVAAAVAGLAVVLVCVPFAVSGRAGILGVGDDNDTSVHLTTAWALVQHVPDTPSLVGRDYPIGPHGVVAALNRGLGVSLPDGFTALELLAPVLAALAALPAVGGLRPRLRVPVAVLIGLPYLMASYLAQGAFKEQLEALLALAFTVGLSVAARRPWPRPPSGREGRWARRHRLGLSALRALPSGLPLGVLAGGTLVVYSFPGIAWPAATAGLALAVAGIGTVVRGPRAAPRALGRIVGRAAGPLAGAGLVIAVVVVSDGGRLGGFGSSSFAHEPAAGLGNLFAPIPAREALGVWLGPDFRLSPSPALLSLLPTLAAAVLAVWGVAAWLRRGEAALVGGLGGAVVVALAIAVERNPYNAAKGLVVLAPLAMLAVAAAIAPALRVPGRGGLVARVASALVLTLAGLSSLLALRDAPVGPTTRSDALEALRSQVGSAPVLYLGTDDFAPWALRGRVLARPVALYPGWTVPLRSDLPYFAGQPVSPMLITATDLDRFSFLITPLSAYDPAPPPNFHLLTAAGGYGLYGRRGPTPERHVPGDDPAGGRLDCSTGRGQAALTVGGRAVVVPAPVIGAPASWTVVRPRAGEGASQVLRVTHAGAWAVSLQYASLRPLRVTGPGLRVQLPAGLDRLGPHWLAGTLHVARPGPVTITVTPAPLGVAGTLLLAAGRTRALDSANGAPLGEIALTAESPRPRSVALARACGRWVRSMRFAGEAQGRFPP